MSKYTKQDIIRMVEDEDVEFIRLQFTDMFGTLKNVAVTSSQLEKALNWDVVAASECRNIMSEREENANLFAFDERRNYRVMKSRYLIRQK